MEVSKIRIEQGTTIVEYETQRGIFLIKTEEAPTKDLYKAISQLHDIFVRRLEFEEVADRVYIYGFETGVEEAGRWYRINGIYTAHAIEHKIKTAKIREIADPDFWERKDPSEWPSYLAPKETEILDNALYEAELFVQGKRDQLVLDLEESV